ncbi:SPOR domain-containing protein [Streptomyces profundus]|uniref:SPOR domain-containing protein n=1 Tax=Streptomyces profundus TaxID=2867410 RepID=UPI001D167B26|nr:SPOR domain-containing protein [Streptomyces sp. MA3_2.13]UED84373.1 SPOR domain-containing protein [Streptomyces sp. MA3_2.13]
MNGSNLHPWQVIRQDKNGSRYRIGHCATRAEAQRLIKRLRPEGTAIEAEPIPAEMEARYLVERVERAARVEAGGRGRR